MSNVESAQDMRISATPEQLLEDAKRVTSQAFHFALKLCEEEGLELGEHSGLVGQVTMACVISYSESFITAKIAQLASAADGLVYSIDGVQESIKAK